MAVRGLGVPSSQAELSNNLASVPRILTSIDRWRVCETRSLHKRDATVPLAYVIDECSPLLRVNVLTLSNDVYIMSERELCWRCNDNGDDDKGLGSVGCAEAYHRAGIC